MSLVENKKIDYSLLARRARERSAQVFAKANAKWRFDDIVTFMRVVESGSVTAAATRLNVSKSVISKRISDLETALDVALFHRSTRNVRPTDTACLFYEKVVPIIQEIEETTERISDRSETLKGQLRLTVPTTFGTMFLGPMIAEFAMRHPDLELTVDYEDRLIDLIHSNYDLGIRIGNLKDSSLKARKLCNCVRIVCCSQVYAERHGLPGGLADLERHTCIDYAYARAADYWQFETESGDERRAPLMMRRRIVANNGEAMRDMAIAGLGLVLLPEFLAAAPLREGRLIRALPHVEPCGYNISAVYAHTHRVSFKVRRFIDYLVAAFVPPLPWERDTATAASSSLMRSQTNEPTRNGTSDYQRSPATMLSVIDCVRDDTPATRN